MSQFLLKLFFLSLFFVSQTVSAAICVANGALSYLHVLIGITFSWCGYPCGRSRTVFAAVLQKGAEQDLIYLLCPAASCVLHTLPLDFFPLMMLRINMEL